MVRVKSSCTPFMFKNGPLSSLSLHMNEKSAFFFLLGIIAAGEKVCIKETVWDEMSHGLNYPISIAE